MSKEQRRLGRGLSSLISAEAPTATISPPIQHAVADTPEPAGLPEIPIDRISPNPFQPRRSFDDAALRQLAESIRSRGTLQPVIVRKTDRGYELIAGERRWRAAKLAGLTTLPAIVREASDVERLELALIENLHRSDLNPVERARAYLEIYHRFKIAIDDIGARVGDDRATVANYIRLLDLPDDVLAMLADGRLSMGHGRAILGLSGETLRSRFAARAVEEGWSVRQTEAKVRETQSGRAERPPPPKRAAVSDVEQRLSRLIGTRVSIREGRRKNSGRITIEYYSLDDFERIVGCLGLRPEA
jgi:ParB family chromosome partitioning protein